MTEKIDKNNFLSIAEQTLEMAKHLGANEAELNISADEGFTVTARNHEVETVEHNRSNRLSLTVYFNTRKGSASISDLSTKAIQQAVQAAADIAKYTSQDKCAGLAAKELMATDFPNIDIDHPWKLDIPKAIDIAVDCENAMYAEQHITNTDGAIVETSRDTVCYANSHGFSHVYSGTQHSITAIAIASDSDAMHRDYWYTVNRDANCLEPHQDIGKTAAQRAARRLGARKPNTCKTAALFSPQIARSLMGILVRSISGGVLYRNASFLCDSLNKKIFPDFFQINEYPHLPGAMGSALFDNEGVAVHNQTLVENGVLKNYVLDSYSARKLNMQTTGNAGGISNLIISGDFCRADDLLKQMDTGFLVSELIGNGVNLVTGDYSYGATGFWVENGAIQYPIEEATIAGRLPEMFANIKMLGDDIDERGSIRCGSILIQDMMLAGN